MKDIYKPLEDKLKETGVKDPKNMAKNLLFGNLYGMNIKGEENENTIRTI